MAQGKEWTKEQKEEIVQSLEPYFKLGYSIKRACILARFPDSSFYEWIKEDDALRAKIEAWQGMVNAKARENKAKEVQRGDSKASEWWLERMDDDFSPKSKHDLTSGGEKLNGLAALFDAAKKEKV